MRGGRLLALLIASSAAAAERLPLPPAPVRLVIVDPTALDTALTGRFREILTGEVPEDDPVVQAWRSTQVGSKLEAQWSAFSDSVDLDWAAVMALRPSAVGLAVLEPGNLEAALVVRTALADLPIELPDASAGRDAEHAGIPYRVVRRGAADGAEDPDRRMGLAVARPPGHLVVTTSVRAMHATLDAFVAGSGVAPSMEGLASLELDGEALREDFYFRREFLFGAERARGPIRAVLKRGPDGLVEIRRGELADEPEPGAARLHAPEALAAGWENDPGALGPALRGALLEPVPVLSDKPARRIVPLPPAREQVVDPYAVDFRKHGLGGGEARFEEGDLAAWAKLLAETPVEGFGYVLLPGRRPVIVFEWPEERQRDLELACRATIERRAGPCTLDEGENGTTVYSVGPGLPALALRRSGEWVFVGADAASVASLPAPRKEPGLLRWASLRLDALRAMGDAWRRGEEAAYGEDAVKPLSDRVQGIAAWMPSVSELTVERRREGSGWTEIVTFRVNGAPVAPAR